MKLGRLIIRVHKAKYLHSGWYNYLIPRKITTTCNPPIYKWCFWVFSFKPKEVTQ